MTLIERHGFQRIWQDWVERFVPVLSLIALICIVAGSCSESSPPVEKVLASEFFPNTVGCTWQYSAYDSITGRTDTVTVEIVGSVKLTNGAEAAVWRHQKSDTIWYRYLSTQGRRVVEYPEISGASANLVYVFPMTIGTEWVSNPLWADTSHVVMSDSARHPACTLGAAYFVERSWSAGVSHGFADTWFVPKVGIIQSDLFSVNSVDTTRETWELISCSLVENIDSTRIHLIDQD